MTKRREPHYCYEVIQGGVVVASVEGDDHNQVRSEILHYARQYAQDGPCIVRGGDMRFFTDTADGEVTPQEPKP